MYSIREDNRNRTSAALSHKKYTNSILASGKFSQTEENLNYLFLKNAIIILFTHIGWALWISLPHCYIMWSFGCNWWWFTQKNCPSFGLRYSPKFYTLERCGGTCDSIHTGNQQPNHSWNAESGFISLPHWKCWVAETHTETRLVHPSQQQRSSLPAPVYQRASHMHGLWQDCVFMIFLSLPIRGSRVSLTVCCLCMGILLLKTGRGWATLGIIEGVFPYQQSYDSQLQGRFEQKLFPPPQIFWF